MAKCVHCGAETILHVNGVPVCTDCDRMPEDPRASSPAGKPDKRPKQPAREQSLHPKKAASS